MKKILFIVVVLSLISGSQANACYSFAYESYDGLASISGMQNTLFNDTCSDINYKEINIYGNSSANDYAYMEWTRAEKYTSYLRGTFTANAVTIPSAIWLLGASLLGLIGIRRRL